MTTQATEAAIIPTADTFRDLKLYFVQHDGDQWYVEARSINTAIKAWRQRMSELFDDEAPHEPESVSLIHDEPVVRDPDTSSAELATARAEAEQYRQRLAQAEADARRLNWLEVQLAAVVETADGTTIIDDEDGDGIRECIDRAMEEPDPPTATEGGAG